MLPLLFALVLAGAATDSIEILYARNEAAALASHCAGVEERSRDLQCRYRLFPLTRDEALIADLPASLPGGSARELALLAGLWGYRASTSGFPGAMRHGMRSQRLMEQARGADPDDPFVLLVDAHATLFKPRIAGGDRRRAATMFASLALRLQAMPDPPVFVQEAQAWQCYALDQVGDPAAVPLCRSLSGETTPALFRAIAAGDR